MLLTAKNTVQNFGVQNAFVLIFIESGAKVSLSNTEGSDPCMLPFFHMMYLRSKKYLDASAFPLSMSENLQNRNMSSFLKLGCNLCPRAVLCDSMCKAKSGEYAHVGSKNVYLLPCVGDGASLPDSPTP